MAICDSMGYSVKELIEEVRVCMTSSYSVDYFDADEINGMLQLS